MGGLVSTLTGEASSGEKPKKENYGNPYTGDMMARLLGAIDAYNETRFGGKGVASHIPAENMPYEMRSPEDRARIRATEDQLAAEQERPTRDLAINEPKAVQPTEQDTIQPRLEAAPRAGYDMIPVTRSVDPEIRRRALQEALKQTNYAPNFMRR